MRKNKKKEGEKEVTELTHNGDKRRCLGRILCPLHLVLKSSPPMAEPDSGGGGEARGSYPIRGGALSSIPAYLASTIYANILIKVIQRDEGTPWPCFG